MKYEIMTVKDALKLKKKEILVPNSTAREVIDIYRYFQGWIKDFPEYQDGTFLIMGIDEEAWMTPKEYKECYCPDVMICITRERG